ncbi:uncharacterized protein HD556DRAFT_1534284 [Suillus plorans]|uniref:Uncharacterized protein n=1 Tax=Suillus plorans TaxID=116603 RepID=A0A9P7DQA3_9AGAM|nr:uncharacterized protein HD556DRAFT_1534284 [Suillus plorans]KAG1800447.1 hypothetical protein HD556DRAFT_1534284 [Suillus plorans]
MTRTILPVELCLQNTQVYRLPPPKVQTFSGEEKKKAFPDNGENGSRPRCYAEIAAKTDAAVRLTNDRSFGASAEGPLIIMFHQGQETQDEQTGDQDPGDAKKKNTEIIGDEQEVEVEKSGRTEAVFMHLWRSMGLNLKRIAVISEFERNKRKPKVPITSDANAATENRGWHQYPSMPSMACTEFVGEEKTVYIKKLLVDHTEGRILRIQKRKTVIDKEAFRAINRVK